MSAYACEPGKGSEPGVGWNWAVQAARSHEVWVITRRNNRASIEAAMRTTDAPNLHFAYHDLPGWARFWKRGPRGVYLYYLVWQLTAVKRVRALHRQIGFDLGHHLTITSFRFPSFFAWTGIPYIWGPLAGGERPPMRFYPHFGAGPGIKQLLRHLSTLFIRIDPLVRVTANRARMILACTEESLAALPRGARAKAEVVTPTAYDVEPCAPRATHASDQMRLLYSGRLVYWKGMQLGVAALGELARSRPGTTLTIAATIAKDGAERKALRELAEALGVSDCIHYADGLSRDEALALYADHDVLLFPSLQDSGGTAVLEAMAAGLAVVCLDIGGPALAVTDETGVRVPARAPGQTVRELAAALDRLAADPDLRRRLGEAGRQRVADVLSWERKGALIDELYRRAVEADDASNAAR